jgi:hypothetical protein
MKKDAFAAGLLALLAPALPAFATGLTLQQVVDQKVIPLVDNAIVPLLYALAFLFFLIGIVRYFFTGGAENKEVGRVYMLWALIGMVVIFGVWGFLQLFLSVLHTG